MSAVLARKPKNISDQTGVGRFARYLPDGLPPLTNPQTALPGIARNSELMGVIHRAVQEIPTTHHLQLGDARDRSALEPESVQLVLTSPPYWTLKEYRRSDGQLGYVADYEEFFQN